MKNSSSHPSIVSGIFSRETLYKLLPPGILAFITGLIYYPSLYYPFQFDDIANISKKFAIRFDNPLSRWLTNTRWLGDWLNSLNFRYGGFDPFSYRLVNVTIHILTGLCLFYLIEKLCRKAHKSEFLTQHAFWVAFISSGLFLLHPVQTQTVSYVIQARLEGLATFFVLTALLLYTFLIESKNIYSKTLFAVLLFTCSFFACGTKEIVIVLPFLLMLIDWFFISNQEWNSFKKRFFIFLIFLTIIPLFLLYRYGFTFFTSVFSFQSQTPNNRGNIITADAFDMITAGSFLISEFKVLLHYIFIFFWPWNMSVEYDWKIATSFFRADVILPLIILLSILGTALKYAWQKTNIAFSFGTLWFLLAIAPRSSIIPSPELVNDYKTYLASIGILFIISTVIVFFVNNVMQFMFLLTRKTISYTTHIGIFATLLLIVGTSAYMRNRVWESSVAFWADNALKAPNKARTHNNHGVALAEAGRVDEAIAAYQKALGLDSHYADPYSNIGVAYSLKGDIDKAIDAFKSAIHICPNYPEAYNNLGSLLIQKKMYDDAIQALNIAIQMRPYYGKAYYNMARLYEEKQDSVKAWEYLKKATQGDLDNPEVFFKLGQLSIKIQKYQEALDAFMRVAQAGFSNEQVLFNIANVHYLLGNYPQARNIYEKLTKQCPLDGRYLYNLAETFFVQNDFQTALNLFRKASTLPQPLAQAFFREATCLEKLNKSAEAETLLKGLLTLNAADDFKKAVRSELARLTLQQKVIAGKGSVKLSDLANAAALIKGDSPMKKSKV